MEAPTLIAEIGCNHMGDLEIAKRFIEVAGSFCEVQNVKFQKRSNRDLLPPEQFDAPHPVPSNSFGDTYGAHREYLEFTLEEHQKLKDHCDERGMTYATSVWDVPSFREIAHARARVPEDPVGHQHQPGRWSRRCATRSAGRSTSAWA